MEVCKLYWWKHNSSMGQYSSAKVHRSLKVIPNTQSPKDISDFTISNEPLDGLIPEIYNGI